MDGGLWGPALLLARHCGEAAFAETAAAMAERVAVPGQPLRTLMLLFAGAPAKALGEGQTAPAAPGLAGGLLPLLLGMARRALLVRGTFASVYV